MKLRFYSFLSLIGLLIALVSLGCASKVVVPFTPVPGSSPVVQIVQPADSATVNGNLVVTVNFSNFAIVDVNGAKNVTGQGHLDFCILNAAPNTDTTQSGPTPPTFVIAGGGSCAIITSSYVLENNLTPGDYELRAELVQNDNSSLNPPVVDSIFITVTSNTNQVELVVNQK